MSNRLITLVSVLVALISLSLWAAEKHGGHTLNMSHSPVVPNISGQPKEGGQSAFVALIEIVAMLEQDPETNWGAVDIDSLRAHLLDMNHLILFTEATTSILGDTKIQFDVRGTEKSIPSIHRMVPAHARFIEQSRGWKIVPELNDDGATLTITVDAGAELSRLNALGIYGFMSLDSHHQAHHYQIAIGNSH